MVFATEFDPREQSQHRFRSQHGSRTQPRPKNRQATSTISLKEISALEDSLKASSQKMSVGHSARNRSARSQSVKPASASQSSADPSAASNAIPLQVSGVAKRVQLDTSATISLPQQPKLPLGLSVLNRLQQGSTAITGLLVTAALLVYGSTVYVDKSTTKAIIQLDELQGEAQQLTSANESIKQTLAEQATRSDSGLEPYEAGDVIFVEPAPLRQKLVESPDKTATEPTEIPGPLGY